jgi:hypothetical protein
MTTTAPDFGLDLSCVDDLDPRGVEVEGYDLMREWCLRVLDTPEGSLVDDEDGIFGVGIVDMLSRGLTQDEIASIPGRIGAAYEQDERILKGSVSARVNFNLQTKALRISIRLSTAAGPFALVVDATKAGVAFVKAEAVE